MNISKLNQAVLIQFLGFLLLMGTPAIAARLLGIAALIYGGVLYRREKKRLKAADAAPNDKGDTSDWAHALAADYRGLTKFQHLARKKLEAALGQLPLQLKGGKERYLTGPLPGTNAMLFVYEDGAQISENSTEFKAERWDYESPEALISALVARALEVAHSGPS